MEPACLYSAAGCNKNTDAVHRYFPFSFLQFCLFVQCFHLEDDRPYTVIAAAYGNTEITAEFVKSDDPADTGAVDYDSNFVEVGEGATVIAVMEYLWGDANMDGNVNVADAQVILQWKVGKDVAIDLTAADADRDGIVAIPDALMLLQYVNQLVEWDPNGTTTKPASLI